MNINYTLRGSIEVPEGSKLNAGGSGIILPDGVILRLWEAWELNESEEGNLSNEQVLALGCNYDGDMAKFEITE